MLQAAPPCARAARGGGSRWGWWPRGGSGDTAAPPLPTLQQSRRPLVVGTLQQHRGPGQGEAIALSCSNAAVLQSLSLHYSQRPSNVLIFTWVQLRIVPVFIFNVNVNIHLAVKEDSGKVRPCVQMVETVQKQPNLISHHLFLGLDIGGH